MIDDTEQSARDEERLVAELMQIGGPRDVMPEDMKQRLSDSFASDLSAQRTARKKRALVFALPVCASFLIAAILFLPRSTPDPLLTPHSIVGELAGNVEVQNGNETRTLSAGDILYSNDVINTRANGLVTFVLGEHQVRLNANSSVRLEQDALRLDRGDVYIDSGDTISNSTSSSVTVRTAYASITDIGTQFMVTSQESATVATVREGIINVIGKNRSMSVAATDKQAMRVDIGATGLQSSSTDKFGSGWKWLERIPGKYTLDGHSVNEYLLWVTQETGLTLEYASELAEQKANSTILKGVLDGKSPALQTLAPVLSTSRLQHDLQPSGNIMVSVRK